MIFIYFIILTLPAYLIRFSIFGLKTNLMDIFLILFLGGWFLRKILRGEKIKESFLRVRGFLLPAILLLSGVSLAVFKSSDIFVSLGIFKSWFILPVLFFIAASDIIKTEKQKISVLRVWFFSGIAVALLGFVYYFLGEITYDGRLKMFFLSPNHLAMFLAGPFIVGLWFLLEERDRLKMVYVGLGVFFIGMALFFTKSLGGFSAILIAVLFLIFSEFKTIIAHNFRNIKICLAVFLLIFLLAGTFFLFYKHDFSKTSSLGSRFIIWRSSLKILEDNIIFGIGLGTFQEKYLEYQKYFEPYLEKDIPQPHNIFLAFWLQTGIMGIVGFLWLIFAFFKNIWEYRKDKIVLFCATLMIYSLAHGLVDTIYWKNDLAIIFWLIILLSLPQTTKTAQI